MMPNIVLQLNIVAILPDGILPLQQLTGNRHWPPQPSCYIPYAPCFIICRLVKLALESQNYPNGNECERKGGREVRVPDVPGLISWMFMPNTP